MFSLYVTIDKRLVRPKGLIIIPRNLKIIPNNLESKPKHHILDHKSER